MKVNLKKEIKDCRFGDLIIGDTFEYGDNVFAVIEDTLTEDGIHNNAYCFDDSQIVDFPLDEIVHPVEVEVIARFA